jgi:hypothetical protein
MLSLLWLRPGQELLGYVVPARSQLWHLVRERDQALEGGLRTRRMGQDYFWLRLRQQGWSCGGYRVLHVDGANVAWGALAGCEHRSSGRVLRCEGA